MDFNKAIRGYLHLLDVLTIMLTLVVPMRNTKTSVACCVNLVSILYICSINSIEYNTIGVWITKWNQIFPHLSLLSVGSFSFMMINQSLSSTFDASGESMENALRACCKGIKIGKILIHREGDNGQQVWIKLLMYCFSCSLNLYFWCFDLSAVNLWETTKRHLR